MTQRGVSRSVAALVLVLLAACSPSRPSNDPPSPTPSVKPWLTYTQPEKGWTIDYPSGWHIQPFDGVPPIPNPGVLISSADVTFQHADCGKHCFTSQWDTSVLPPDAVMLEVVSTDGTLQIELPRSRTTPLPLSFEQFHGDHLSFTVATGSRQVDQYHLKVTSSGSVMTQMQVNILARMIASLSFPGAKNPVRFDDPVVALVPGSDGSPMQAPLPYLAVLAKQPNSYMDAMGHGPLVEQNGCVVVAGARHGTLVVWPPGYHLELSGSDTALVDGAGKTLATLGEDTSFGGGYVPWTRSPRLASLSSDLAEPIPAPCRFSQVFYGWYGD